MSESKLRKLNPVKLEPPKEVLEKNKSKRKESLQKNPVIRFFTIFFGEGF